MQGTEQLASLASRPPVGPARLVYGRDVATWDAVRRIARALPETTEQTSGEGLLQWRVRGKGFAWERPLRRADITALGAAAPEGPILAAYVPDLGVKEALLAGDANVYFTTPHFDGYAAILVRLDRISVAELQELLVEAWLSRAPKRLAKQYLAASGWATPEPRPRR
jgi:hypothetical protein